MVSERVVTVFWSLYLISKLNFWFHELEPLA